MPVGLLAGLASMASSELGQAAISSGGTMAAQGIYNSFFGDNAADPKMNKLNQFRQQYEQQLQSPGIQPSFDPIEQRELSRFDQSILPQVASQFNAPGLERSSASQQALAGARTDLGERLASMRQQFDMQRESNRMQRLGMQGQYLSGQQQYGLQRAGQRQQGQQFMDQMRQQQQMGQMKNLLTAYGLTQEQIENILHTAQQSGAGSFFEKAGPVLAKGGGAILGGLLAGPPGAAAAVAAL